MKEERCQILNLHSQVLKCLLIWPMESLSNRQNKYLMYGVICIAVMSVIPTISLAGYQIYMGIGNIYLLIEALIGLCNYVGFFMVYTCFLKNQVEIKNIIVDINIFAKYCGHQLILKTDAICTRYTKYILCYVIVSVTFTVWWPMTSIETCIISKGTEFYVKHSPCGMTSQKIYPFDASERKYFWIIFPIDSINVYQITLLFSLATVMVAGFLMHITAQLKCCGYKFKHIFDDVNEDEQSSWMLPQMLYNLIEYHQDIIKYAERVFNVFDLMIVVYVSIPSFILALSGFQVVKPELNSQDKVRYVLVLAGWCLLFYSTCYFAQQVRDESVKVSNALYQSKWYENGHAVKFKKEIKFVLARTQKPLTFKVQFFGTLSLQRFLNATNTAYSMFTLLLTTTSDV